MIPIQKISYGRAFNAHRFWAYYLMRLAVQPALRRMVAGLDAACVNLLETGRGDRLRDQARQDRAPIVEPTARELQENGFATMAPLLDERAIGEIHDYLAGQDALAGSRQVRVVPNLDTQGIRHASYPLETIVACPHLLDTINSPALLDVVESYLGCRPTVTSLGLRWSFPADEGGTDVQFFHRDVECWRMLKFFIYLTDVDETAGPHEYVLRSQRGAGRLRLQPYDDIEVAQQHGANVKRVLGRRGTNFIEDTWGIHKGVRPTGKPRLLFDVMYSASPVGIYQYDPVASKDASRYDAHVNRLMLRSPARTI